MKNLIFIPAISAILFCNSLIADTNSTWIQASPQNSSGGAGGSILNNYPASSLTCEFSLYPPMTFYVFDSTGGNSSSFNKWYLVFDGQTVGSWIGGNGGVYAIENRVQIPTLSQGVKYKIGQFNYYLPTDAEQNRYYTNAGTKVMYKVCREPAS